MPPDLIIGLTIPRDREHGKEGKRKGRGCPLLPPPPKKKPH